VHLGRSEGEAREADARPTVATVAPVDALSRATALADASRAFAAATPDLAALVVAVARAGSSLVGDACTVRLAVEDGDELEAPVGVHPDPAWAAPPGAGDDLCARVQRSGRPITLAEVTPEALLPGAGPDALARLARWPVFSFVAAPMQAGGRVLGVLALTRGTPGRSYGPDDEAFVQGLAEHAALAIANARLLRSERARAAEATRAHERFLDSIIENIPDMIFVKDAAELRFVRFNRAGEDLLGFERAELLGKNDYDFFPRAEADAFTTKDRQVLAGRAVVDIPAEPIHTRLKGARTLHTKKIPVMGPDGAPLYLLGISEDITEREQLRAALTQSEKLAALGLLSAGIAHEINNPLAYVAGNLHVIERDAKALVGILDAYEGGREAFARVDPEAAALVAERSAKTDLDYLRQNLAPMLGRTRDGIRRITRIIEALGRLARTERPDGGPTDLRDVASATLDVIRGRMERRGIELVLDWGPDPIAYGVPTLLSQVLLNLLTNAMYAVEAAHPGGGGRIRVASRSTVGGVILEVTDDGVGIDPAERAKIFDPFYTTKPVGEGTGLGLSITHNIVASHGGRIEVESTPGQGSCFRVHLPNTPPMPKEDP